MDYIEDKLYNVEIFLPRTKGWIIYDRGLTKERAVEKYGTWSLRPGNPVRLVEVKG